MRTNYQYTAVTGESWLRAKRIVIDNPLNGLPVAKFVEERVVNIAGGEQYFRDQGVLEVPATGEQMDCSVANSDECQFEYSQSSFGLNCLCSDSLSRKNRLCKSSFDSSNFG